MKWRRRANRWMTILGENKAYLLNDTFTTDRSAGDVNGTPAEPGAGGRVATDSNSKLTITAGMASFATGGSAVGNPGLWYEAVARVVGRILKASVTPADLNGNVIVGWDVGQSGAITDSFRFGTPSGAMAASPNSGSSALISVYAAATTYEVALILRATGAVWMIKTGSNWLLYWVSAAGSGATASPGLSTINTTAVYTCEYILVPTALWLPTSLASDGFGSAFGTTDGLGHAEGVAGGLGTGGSGLTWTQQVGTWQTSGGTANASALSGGSAAAYTATVADVIATVKLTRSGGVGGLLLRFADGNNFITCRHDGTNVLLVKKVAGVDTTVQTTVVTYVAGAEIRVSAEGQKFRLYYNNVQIGTEQTIADAALQSPVNHGLYTTSTGNTFDDFTVYARGTGGEYAILDTF